MNLLDKSSVPRRSDLKLSDYEMSVVSYDKKGLTDNQKFLIDFFDSKTGGKRFARRDDFDPIEITKYLPYIALVDIDTDDKGKLKNLKARLFGTALVDFYGEWTGHWLKDSGEKDSLKQIHPNTYKRVFAITNLILKERKPITLFSDQVSDDRSHWKISLLAIPFSQNGTEINMFLLYVELTNEP